MSVIQKLRRKSLQILRSYKESMKDCYVFAKQCLTQKRILIISDKKIINIPVSSQVQSAVVVAMLALFLWVSYSTGQYFAYESILSQKEKEIWSSNMLNQNLQHQVSDLYENLEELNRYFLNMQQLDQTAKRSETVTVGNTLEPNEGIGIQQHSAQFLQPETETQRILFNIRDKIQERIETLEHIVELTGMQFDELVSNNTVLNKVYREARVQTGGKGLPEGQGGPFEPLNVDEQYIFDREKFVESVNYLRELEKAVNQMPLTYPLDKYRLSSGFGKRRDPFRGVVATHKGLDFIGKKHAKVHSTAPGVVAKARRYGAYGKLVEIDHGNGFTTRFGHLNKILVRKGQRVSRGEVIGIQGTTGRSTGDHVHYEVRFNKIPYNPMKFLKAGTYVF